MQDPTFNPEFLERRAQAMRDAGAAAVADAHALDTCAKQWRDTEAQLQAAFDENTELQRQLNNIRRVAGEARA